MKIKTFKKQLFLEKINLDNKNNSYYYNSLNKLFYNPENYFDKEINGQKVIIGTKYPKTKNYISIGNHSNQRKRGSVYKNIKIIKGPANSRSSFSIRDSQKSIVMMSMANGKHYLNDKELSEIYDKFSKLKEKNKLLKKSLIYDKNLLNSLTNFSIKDDFKQSFNLQNTTFKTRNYIQKKINLISKKISNKIKRPIDQLLINQSEFYREKNELKNNLSNEIRKQNQEPPYKWITNLRDKDKHYFNIGTNEHPNWQVYKHKNKINSNDFEIIRKPINQKLSTNNTFNFTNTECSHMRSYSNNSYIKSKLPYKTLSHLNEIFDRNNELNSLYIEGKDLLKTEIVNSKNLKGRKFINLPISPVSNNYVNNINKFVEPNFNENNNEIILKNEDVKEIIKNREKKKLSNYFLS